MPIATVNPATGATLRTFAPLTEAELDRRIGRAAEAFRAYRRTTFGDRARLLSRAADILEADQETLARLMVTEMGKPIQAARDEVAKSARGCRYYAEYAERFLAPEEVETGASRSLVRYDPLGPVLAVMPWNFPFWQVFRFAAPALMAGNVALLKHASNVPQCALAIENIFRRAGFPDGCFGTLLIEADGVRRVIEDRRVAAVTLTGSTRAGSEVASAAGKVVKKTVLELGGSDPFIVLPSADLDAAARTAVKARTINNGQSCIAAKRFILHESIADELERRIVAGMAALRVGDPMAAETDLGPLATRAQVESVAEQVARAVEAGARVLTGGRRLDDRPGYYYAPTVLRDVGEASPVYREEVFGPVAILFRVRDLDQAIALANDSPFGLGASAWTRDEAEQGRLVAELEAGLVFINAMVASDPRLPFGGVKQSGYGRELAGHGIREFVNTKTVWIDAGGTTAGGRRAAPGTE
jgi:succinate-semialdehyde dehydrogenase/glutarate-semialdehyde dehydrogenase